MAISEENSPVLQIRIVTSIEKSAAVLAAAKEQEGAAEIALFRGASVVPTGDVLMLQLARESAEEFIEKLRTLDVTGDGSISVTSPELVLSQRADRAERRAHGAAADAVIWDEVKSSTKEESSLTWSFLLFLIIATALAGIGIVTDSTIAIVGAMVVGPEFGPLSGLSFAIVERNASLARKSALALLLGFPAAMTVVAGLTALAIATGLVPADFLQHGSPATEFIYHPGPFSFIVALLAGAAGMLSLIGRKSAVLVGVFISVTTVPAAGFVAVALVLGEPAKASGSAIQLLINLAGIVVSSVVVLIAYKLALRHRRLNPADED